MYKNQNRQLRRDLVQAILNSGGHLYEAEYILGKLPPGIMLIPEKVSVAKVIWDSGREIEDVVKVLTA